MKSIAIKISLLLKFNYIMVNDHSEFPYFGFFGQTKFFFGIFLEKYLGFSGENPSTTRSTII